jgi:hypothetical protein
MPWPPKSVNAGMLRQLMLLPCASAPIFFRLAPTYIWRRAVDITAAAASKNYGGEPDFAYYKSQNTCHKIQTNEVETTA